MRFFRRGGTRLTPTLSSLDAYALWAETYPPQAHNALMRAEEAAVLSLMPDVTGAAILDLACGTGRYGRIARERGAAYVTGIDNSLPMLRGNPLAERVQATTERLPAGWRSVICLRCCHLLWRWRVCCSRVAGGSSAMCTRSSRSAARSAPSGRRGRPLPLSIIRICTALMLPLLMEQVCRLKRCLSRRFFRKISMSPQQVARRW